MTDKVRELEGGELLGDGHGKYGGGEEGGEGARGGGREGGDETRLKSESRRGGRPHFIRLLASLKRC